MKRKHKPTYSLMAVLMASPTEPTPEFLRTHQLTRMHGGLHAIVRGDDPKPDDWRVVSDAVNFMETLVDEGVVSDDQGLLHDAAKAMHAAAVRSQNGKGIRLDASGIQALSGVLQDYQDVLETLPHRTMMQCYVKTEHRIRELQAGRGKAHDVEVTSL